jgi:acetylornithine deacetylase/succinyl-diaminopimelate desuccinylase-like protein
MDDVIMDLQTLIRQPSVSAKQEGLFDCAELVSHIIQRAGIKTELLHLTDLKAMDVNFPFRNKHFAGAKEMNIFDR